MNKAKTLWRESDTDRSKSGGSVWERNRVKFWAACAQTSILQLLSSEGHLMRAEWRAAESRLQNGPNFSPGGTAVTQ